MTDIQTPQRSEAAVPTDPPPQAPTQAAPEVATPTETWQQELPQFNSADDLAKSYKHSQQMVSQKDARIQELEALLGKAGEQPESSPEGGDPTSPDGQPGDAGKGEEGEPKEEPKGFDWDTIDTYMEDGKPKEELFSTLAEHGIPEEYSKLFFEMAAERQQRNQEQAIKMVGSQEDYNKLVDWVREKVPHALDDLNDPQRWEYALAGLIQAAKANNVLGGAQQPTPTEPSPAPGTGVGASSEAPMSDDEFAAATMTQRYWTDETYAESLRRRNMAWKSRGR